MNDGELEEAPETPGRLRAALDDAQGARERAELLERHAADLAAARTVDDVGRATVSNLHRFGIDIVVVQLLRDPTTVEVVATVGIAPESLRRFLTFAYERDDLVQRSMKSGEVIVFATGADYDDEFPRWAAERQQHGVETILALPLRASDGQVIGSLYCAVRRPGWLDESRRFLLLGIAEQCGLALDRARLQAAADAAAADAAQLARLSRALEGATVVVPRAQRLVDLLAEGTDVAAAVYLFEDFDDTGRLVLVASAGGWPDCVDMSVVTDHIARLLRDASAREAAAATPVTGAAEGYDVVCVPLVARGRALGGLALCAAPEPVRTFPRPSFVRDVAAYAGLALDNARLYEQEREVSQALQLGLLGGPLPSAVRARFSAAYRPATVALEVGGDWYDAFPLPSGELALVVGDVVGHGLDAAVAMGQLRGAVRALAPGADPADVLARLDVVVEHLPAADMATVAYAVYEPGARTLHYACAGHPPPLLVRADGTVTYLWDGRSAPLGATFGVRRGSSTISLATGDTVVLYTDGLVERRDRAIDAGLRRLADAAAARPAADPDLAADLCDALLPDDDQEDDACVLTLHVAPADADRLFVHELRASPSELAGLRRELADWLATIGVSAPTAWAIVLAASEAAANAVEHGYGCDGRGRILVTACHEGAEIALTVADRGSWRDRASGRDRGRGRAIMERVMDDVVVRRLAGCTTVRMRARL